MVFRLLPLKYHYEIGDFLHLLHRNKGFLVILTFCAMVFFSPFIVNNAKSYRLLNYIYPNQTQHFWNSIESGIHEVRKFETPATFVFFYEPQAEETLGPVLKTVGGIISQMLRGNGNPFVMTSRTLNLPPYSKDYGEIIEKVRKEVVKSGVLIVKNLENVNAQSAQAFHTICDEHTPLINKAIIIFTIKVDKFPKDDYLYLRKLLWARWHELSEDIFEPLFTRISSMILRISPDSSSIEVGISKYYFMYAWYFGVCMISLSILFLGCSCIILSGMVSYRNLLLLMDRYPRIRGRIWRSLVGFAGNEQLFLFGAPAELKYDILEYLMKENDFEVDLVLTRKDLDDINAFYRTHKHFFREKVRVILVVEEIERVHRLLMKIYYKDEYIREALNNQWVSIIYTVEDPKHFKHPDLDCFLNKEFLGLLPSRRILKVR